jgi:hypothetical protein
VYVVVLMLPLVFAAMVWPARRIWAMRSLELLVALILSKFAIVAVLSLGGAALGAGVNDGLAGVLSGVVLLILGAFAPWAILRLLPLAEVASGAAGALRGHSLVGLQHVDAWATHAERWAGLTAQMQRTADPAEPAGRTAAPVSGRDDAVGPRTAAPVSGRDDAVGSRTAASTEPREAPAPASPDTPEVPHDQEA